MLRVKTRIEELLKVVGFDYKIKVIVEPNCETIAYIEDTGLGICRFEFNGEVYHQVVVVYTDKGVSYPKEGLIYLQEKNNDFRCCSKESN